MTAALWLLLAPLAGAQELPANFTSVGQIYVNHGIVAEPEALNGARGITTVGLHGTVLAFDGGVGFGDFTLGLGMGGDKQFAYTAEILIGAGSWFGDYFGAGIGGGIGGNSVHERLPAAFRIPMRLVLLTQHPDAFTLELFGGFEYLPSRDNIRTNGSTTIDFMDEFKWGANVYIGRPNYADDQKPAGGVSLGFTWYETMGTTIYEVRLAFSTTQRPENTPKKKKKKRRRRPPRPDGPPPKPPAGPR